MHGHIQQSLRIERISPSVLRRKYCEALTAFAFGKERMDPKDVCVVLVKDKGTLMGFARVSNDGDMPILEGLEIEPSFRNQGHSKLLLAAVFDVARELSGTLYITNFTKLGSERLRHNVERMAHGNPGIDVYYM